MARERKFNFIPTIDRDLRKKVREENEFVPFVRIQKSNQMVFSKKTLEHLGMPTGKDESVWIKFFIDQDKRAIGFRIIDKTIIGDESVRLLSVRHYVNKTNNSLDVRAAITITSLLMSIGEHQTPLMCELGEYDDNDSYLGVGKVHYFIVPKVRQTKKHD